MRCGRSVCVCVVTRVTDESPAPPTKRTGLEAKVIARLTLFLGVIGRCSRCLPVGSLTRCPSQASNLFWFPSGLQHPILNCLRFSLCPPFVVLLCSASSLDILSQTLTRNRMLRRDARLFAPGVRTAAVGAPRRATVHAQSSSKRAKDRFDLNEALLRDRERIERNKMLPWREKLKQLNEYPWKFFIAFMILWSWLGTYVVPKMKGLKSGEAPSLGTGAVLPDDVKAKTFVTPRFTHLK